MIYLSIFIFYFLLLVFIIKIAEKKFSRLDNLYYPETLGETKLEKAIESGKHLERLQK